MAFPSSCRIHPTAVISPEVELGEMVEVGALAIIEGKVKIGDQCIIRPGAVIYGPLQMGRGNTVHSGAILGDTPQHLKFNNEPTWTEIGDRNVFREHVTVHRGTVLAMKTTVGSDNFFMASSHIGHDSIVGNRCILANGALVGGHCVLNDSVYLSGNSAVHQFVRIGRLGMLAGCSATTKDVPPFVTQVGIDNVTGVNLVGMKRAGLSHVQIDAVRCAFKMLFRQGLILPVAMAKMEKDLGDLDVIQEMLAFLRGCHKGINVQRGRLNHEAA